MKWNDRVSNRKQRYIDYLNTMPMERLELLMKNLNDEKYQYIHSDGWTVLWTYFVLWVKITCENENEVEFLKTTCQSIIREKKINTIII
jgi:hypothetical protein